MTQRPELSGADGEDRAKPRTSSGRLRRRQWLGMTLAGTVLEGLGGGNRPGWAADGPDPAVEEADELRRAEDRTRRVSAFPLVIRKSAHYQAIGDASATFFKLTLSDCEQMATDFLEHFRSHGFDVKLPGRRMTVIVFRDERPFVRLAENAPPGTMGFYSLPSNWLALFDFRNAPMHPGAAGQNNMETLTHEATHQLCFNTGLLVREADTPLSIIEGLAMYCERRRLFDRGKPGQANLRRLDELAHIRRREPWVGVEELLGDDRASFRRNGDRMLLSYAESWLMVYHLMSDPLRLPQFRAYLATVRTRRDRTHRLEDARTHFGDLAVLDRELRQEGVRLQRGR